MTEHNPRTWLSAWTPEDPGFWESTGKSLAWKTLTITTLNLIMAFIVWFVVSALVVRLPNVGFKLSANQLFWLTAMPGLAAGILRTIHTFLVPIYGTRHVVTFSTLSLLIPALGWFWAVQNPATPYWILLLLAFLAGLGGGNFSSFMPSTSLFFPKRLQGTALAIQAGIGNFGVSVVQFVTPWIIGFALFGTLAGDPLTFTKGDVSKPMWLQNATLVYVPFIVVFAIAAWFMLKSVPVRANIKEQFDIFGNKHTWTMTSLYIMTFGSFSGFSATFPLLIKQLYGGLPGGPDPLAYAFYGPLIGSAARVVAGPISDKFGGAIVTQISGVGLLACLIGVTLYTTPTSMEQFPMFVGLMLGVFFFTGVGNASTFKQMPMIFEPRQAGGVIGFTGAMAAFGPFIWGSLVGASFAATGSVNAFLYGLVVFYVVNVGINWWFYARSGAEKPC
ncbi:MAG: NarK/NasA family nitrate transporter [Candidatus Contendobacter sp.]|nr:NarK/NasA family nitrate transporter [Candidatus Contendobacter sp.]MDG4595757.1 NarK/NasA family nitrate transporter [Candidatus Contendobacter sp.]